MHLPALAVVVTAVYATALALAGTSTPARAIGGVLLAVLVLGPVLPRLRRAVIRRPAAVLPRDDVTAAPATPG